MSLSGAGPAGMETALTAARRGHEVIVLEKESRVGGQIWPGSASPLRKDWARIAEFYQRMSEMNLFQVRLNTNATLEAVLGLKPDAVVVATGSRPVRLEILNGMAASTVHERSAVPLKRPAASSFSIAKGLTARLLSQISCPAKASPSISSPRCWRFALLWS